MHLTSLLAQYARRSATSVPQWMIGCFKRRSISFANGSTDTQTHVFWLQSRNITIDLRLPADVAQDSAKPLGEYSDDELRRLANYEGWYAESRWQNDKLSWSGGTALQIHNRWPEPALLQRIGDCMIEFSPGGTYVEDWRMVSRTPGPLIGLRLSHEEELSSGRIRHRDGALIVNGDWAGLVLGRSSDIPPAGNPRQLRDLVAQERDNEDFLQQAFNFETSVATGNLQSGFSIDYTTQPARRGASLFPLEGFEFDPDSNEVIHIFEDAGVELKRSFRIDTIERQFPFSATTAFTPEASDWFSYEQETLGRYLTFNPAQEVYS